MNRIENSQIGYTTSRTILSAVLSTVAAAIVLAIPAVAQEQGFGATTDLALGSDSNIYRTQNDISDQFLLISPKIGFKELQGKHVFTLGYDGTYIQYNDLSKFNYENHEIGAKAEFDHNTKLTSQFTVKFIDGVELPGLNNSITTDNLTDFNQIQRQQYEAKVAYGRSDSIGQVVLRYLKTNIEYDNNNQAFRDYEADRITATFFYRIAPKTRLLFEAADRSIDYTNQTTFNSSSQYRNYLVGAEWTATGKTRGVVKLGQQSQDFDNPLRDNISGLAVFADVFWKANTYTELQLGLSRQTAESAEASIGSFVQTDLKLSLEHAFTPRISLDGGYIYGEDDIVFSNNRTDKRHTLEVSLKHDTSRLFQTFFTLQATKRSSNDARYDYSANNIMIGIQGTFGQKV